MTTFEDRERAFEAKFALDGEGAFLLAARRDRLFGQWAAEKLKLTPEESEAYLRAVVHADLGEAGPEDMIRKVHDDLKAASVETSEQEVRAALETAAEAARRAMLGSA